MIPSDISLYSVKMRLIHSTAKGQWPWSEPIEGQSAAALRPSPYCWFSLIYLLCPCPVEASLNHQRRQCDMTATNNIFCLSHTNLYTCTVLSHIFSSRNDMNFCEAENTYLLIHISTFSCSSSKLPQHLPPSNYWLSPFNLSSASTLATPVNFMSSVTTCICLLFSIPLGPIPARSNLNSLQHIFYNLLRFPYHVNSYNNVMGVDNQIDNQLTIKLTN